MTTYYRRREPRYSEKFKRSIVKEAMSGDESLAIIARRHNIGLSSIYRWLNCYEEEFLSTLAINENESSNQMNSSPLSPDQDPVREESKETGLRIEELEEALRLAKLKIEAYEHLIELAEEEYKISIKKKYGTKRSKE